MEIEEFFGPYEAWILKYGKFYDFPTELLKEEAVVSYIAFIQPEVDTSTIESAGDFFSVVYWENSLGDGFSTHFIPFVLKSKDETDRAITYENLTLSTAANGIIRSEANFNPPRSLFFQKNTRKSSDAIKDSKIRANYPVPKRTFNEQVSKQSNRPQSRGVNKPRKTVIVAIVDDGIPFAHKSLRIDGNQTRVEYCWSQGATSPQDGSESVLFGREFSKMQIEDMLKQFDQEEDAIYEAAGLSGTPETPPMPLDRIYSHGAHVLGTITSDLDEDTDYCIIAVDLPAVASFDTSGFGKDMYVLSAFHYIFERADDLAKSMGLDKPLPLVINFSYGISGGSHNGNTILEAALDELILKRREAAPTSLVMPAANFFNDRMQAVLTDRNFTEECGDFLFATLDWQLQPNDMTSSFLELWFPRNIDDLDTLNLQLLSPSGEAALWFSFDGFEDEFDVKVTLWGQETVIGKLYRETYNINEERMRFVLAMAPTEARELAVNSDGDRLASAPSGTWRLKIGKPNGVVIDPIITGRDGEAGVGGIEIRIQRDQTFGQGNTGARQSYLRDSEDQLFWVDGTVSQVDNVKGGVKARRFGSINGLATGVSSLVVAGYDNERKRAAPYSGAGSLRYDTRNSDQVVTPVNTTQVNLAATSDRNQWQKGVRSAGARSGFTVAANGTSSAAPSVSRELVKLFYCTDTSVLLNGEQNAAAELKNYLWLLTDKNGIDATILNRNTAHPASKQRLGKGLLRN